MKKSPLMQLVFGGMLIAVLSVAPAQAQPRTWVSGTGNDANPCSLTAPCKTFAGAYTKTAAGGEISVLDPGGYGQVTISKALTINAEGTLASILATSTGITVSAAAGDRVVLRNIMINGSGSGGSVGIAVNSGHVTIDKCFIYGFTNGFIGGIGIGVFGAGTTYVDVRDTNITSSSHGVFAQSSSGFVSMSLDNVRINDTPGYGVAALTGGVFMTVRNSLIKDAGVAAIYTGGASTINVEHSALTNSAVAVNAGASGSTIRLNENSLYNNTTDLALVAGATIATAANNKSGGGAAGAAPNGTVSNF